MKLHTAIGLLLMMAVYAGLAVLFYSPEQGFNWFFGFLGLSILVLVVFALLLKRALTKELAKVREKGASE